MTAAAAATVAAPARASWLELAACRGRDTMLWFSTPSTLEAQVATALCQRCPVRRQCLAAALVEETDGYGRHGIRGGLTPVERHQLARQRGEVPVVADQRGAPVAAAQTPVVPVIVRWRRPTLVVL